MKQTEFDSIIDAALREDLAGGDVTSSAIFGPNAIGRAVFRAKLNGVIAGLPVAARVFKILNPRCVFRAKAVEGRRVKAGTIVAEVRGPMRALLAGERTALNILQRLSGIATLTRHYVDAVRGLPVKILDTRKTAPGLRILDKYAVKCGGGANHRMSLSDLAMIKDNHIKAAGSIAAAVQSVRRKAPRVGVEVETANLTQVREALAAGADIIMLDNMSLATMRKAVKFIHGRARVEASGSISLDNVRVVAKTGVNVISIGRLTHSAPALDISMKIV